MLPALTTPQLTKYELLQEIGHGGMATVYRARDKRLGREVAVKLIHRHLRESEEVEARFNSEARAVAKLKHPNIVEVYDVSAPEEDERYLVVELIRGTTLRELLKRQGALPVELAAEIVLEIAAALQHAHREGVIHRDVKPENVLIEKPSGDCRSSSDNLDRPRIKLTDFGIAKLLDAQGVTSTGQVLGSPAHMAPEQIEGKVVDCRADIFSLGVLFYECVVGSLPFAGNNPAQVLRNVLDGNFDAPLKVDPRVGGRFSALVVRALQKDPEGRFATVAEFESAIRTELERLGFDNVRRDITQFVSDPGGYRTSFSECVVAALVKDATEARSQQDVLRASAQLNRALAYEPRHREVLGLLSGLRRRRSVRRAIATMLAAVASVGTVLALWQLWPSSTVSSISPASDGPTSASAAPASLVATAAARQQPTAQRPPVPASPRAPTAMPVVSPPPKKIGPRSKPWKPAAVEATRAVSVRITGAPGGSVRIDGDERPWFGVTHELTLGAHVIEFIPPDETCCVAQRRTIEVVEGDGPQLVVGRIGFKQARVRVGASQSEGWLLSCPTLFPLELKLPGERPVAMSQLTVQGTCTLSNLAEGSATRRKVVTLRAGNTTVLPWP